MKHLLVLLTALLVAVAAGCSEAEPESAELPAATDDVGCAGADLLDCARASTLAPLVPDRVVAADGEPVTIGMMNIEASPAGSYDELSRAVQAGVSFVNTELGGLDGRPIELSVCNTGFSAEGSAACGQRLVEDGVAAVLGGVDVFGNGIGVLEDNGVPFVGGIPISIASVEASNSFQFSGGTWGAVVAFVDHALEAGAEHVAVVFGEFPPITRSAELGRELLEREGARATMVPFPVTAVDLTPAVQAAAAANPDAVIVLGADTGCRAAFDALASSRVSVPTYHTGACATPAILDQVDPDVRDAAVFNVEGPISAEEPDADTVLYGQVIDRYGEGLDPVGAGTVSFRSFMNLFSILADIGADDLDASTVDAALRAAQDRPSFMGHPYTCDGRQFPDLPAVCAPQQLLVRHDGEQLVEIGSWVDVGAIAGRDRAAPGRG